jgi:hypothetical protein
MVSSGTISPTSKYYGWWALLVHCRCTRRSAGEDFELHLCHMISSFIAKTQQVTTHARLILILISLSSHSHVTPKSFASHSHVSLISMSLASHPRSLFSSQSHLLLILIAFSSHSSRAHLTPIPLSFHFRHVTQVRWCKISSINRRTDTASDHSFLIRCNTRQTTRTHAPLISNSSDEENKAFCCYAISVDLERFFTPPQNVWNGIGSSLSYRGLCSSSPAQVMRQHCFALWRIRNEQN